MSKSQFSQNHPFIGSLYRVYFENNEAVDIHHVNSIHKDYNDSEPYCKAPSDNNFRRTAHCATHKDINEAIASFPTTRLHNRQQLYIFSAIHLQSEEEGITDCRLDVIKKKLTLIQTALF